MARFPGNVHGVVVQMTTLASSRDGSDGTATGNRTHTVVEVWS